MLTDIFFNCVEPLVSVVIPTRNRSQFLPRALNSILNQKYSNFEIIIVDDNSTDDTKKIVEVFSSKFKHFIYLQNNQAKGAAYSRYIGIKKATGKYIAFLDDDDEWLQDKIVKQVKKLEENPEIGGVSCWYYKINNNYRQKIRLPPKVTFDMMLWENFLGSFSFCLTKSKITKGLKLDQDLSSSQDWAFWLVFLQKAKVNIIKEYLVNYHEHSQRRISNTDNLKYEGREKIFLKYKDYMNENCKKYRYTYLIIAKSLGKSTNNFIKSLNLFFLVLKNPFLITNRFSRFALKRFFLIQIQKLFNLHEIDHLWLTYKFISKPSSKKIY